MPISTDQREFYFDAVLYSDKQLYFDAIKRNYVDFPYIGELYLISPELFKYLDNKIRKGASEYSVIVPPDNIIRFYLMRKINLGNLSVKYEPFFIELRIIINNGATDIIIDNIKDSDILKLTRIKTGNIEVDINFMVFLIDLDLNTYASKGDTVNIRINSYKFIGQSTGGGITISPDFTDESVTVGGGL